MNKIASGWFSELNEEWPGQSFCLEIEEVLHREKSQYQDILVFKRYLIIFNIILSLLYKIILVNHTALY